MYVGVHDLGLYERGKQTEDRHHPYSGVQKKKTFLVKEITVVQNTTH
jgi:hypothetical protein